MLSIGNLLFSRLIREINILSSTLVLFNKSRGNKSHRSDPFPEECHTVYSRGCWLCNSRDVQIVRFVTSLSNCQKLCIPFLVDLSKHDLRTVLCKNLESIAEDCNVHSRNLNKFCVKQNMIYNHISLDQEWKLPNAHSSSWIT